jgi:hypothetical protein
VIEVKIMQFTEENYDTTSPPRRTRMSLTELPDTQPPFRRRKRPRTVPVLAFLLGGLCLLLSGVPFLVMLFWILAVPAIFMGAVAFSERYPMRVLGAFGAILAMVSLGAGIGSTIRSFDGETAQRPAYNAAAAPGAVPGANGIGETSVSQPAVTVAPAPPTAPEPVAPVAPVVPVVPAAPENTQPASGNSGADTNVPQQDDSPVYYANCSAVRAAGKAPLTRYDPGYAPKLDRDGDGIACE